MFKKYKAKFKEQLSWMEWWVAGNACKSCDYIIMRCKSLIEFIDRAYDGDETIDRDLLLNRCEEFSNRIAEYQKTCKCDEFREEDED